MSVTLGSRALFPHLEPFAYLNHAAVSPPSLLVSDAVRACLQDYERRGMGAFMDYMEDRNVLREQLADLIGAAAEDIALVAGTTRGLIDIAGCIDWQTGDRIILFRGEFPANVTPWQQAAKTYGCEIVMLELDDWLGSGGVGLQRLSDELSRGARLVAVSAVQFATGLAMPLAEIAEMAHAVGAEVCVDGIQAVGAFPIDVVSSGVDYMSCGAHKWLMGLEGAGFAYIAGSAMDRLRLRAAGWLSHEEGLRFLLEGSGHLRYDRPVRRQADFLEVGAWNTLGFVGLRASVEAIASIGVDAVLEHCLAYGSVAEEGLIERGFVSLRHPDKTRRSAILSVEPPTDVPIVALQAELTRRGVSCSMPDGVLRLAPHWPNNAEREMSDLLAAVDESLAACRT